MRGRRTASRDQESASTSTSSPAAPGVFTRLGGGPLLAFADGMKLNLSPDELASIQDYFRSEGREPSETELQAVAQAWSEHCCYKSSKVWLREYVFPIDSPDVVARGDAGVMRFDDEFCYAIRIESHNHPSALEPYGGAATGSPGVPVGRAVRPDSSQEERSAVQLGDPITKEPLMHACREAVERRL